MKYLLTLDPIPHFGEGLFAQKSTTYNRKRKIQVFFLLFTFNLKLRVSLNSSLVFRVELVQARRDRGLRYACRYELVSQFNGPRRCFCFLYSF